MPDLVTTSAVRINWFESNSRDETAMNSDLFIMYIIASSELLSYPRDNIVQ